MQQKRENLFFSVVIPGKVGIKKNNRKNIKDRYGRMRNIPSDRYRNWEAVAIPHITHALVRQPEPFSRPAICDIHAEFEFYFKDNRALPDTSNCIEGPQDAMESCGVYANDKQIVSIQAKRFVSHGEERTVIRLYRVEP